MQQEPHNVLGLQPDADETAIRAAYAEKVRADHPDHGGTGQNLKALKQARDAMLGRAPKPQTTCKICGGKGWVRTGGFKPERCPRGC